MQAVYWYVEFELLSEVTMKRSVLLDVKLFGPLKVIGMEVCAKLVSCLAHSLTLDCLTFSRLHGIISQKIELCIYWYFYSYVSVIFFHDVAKALPP
jgi:hypothetical protein